MAYDGMWGVLFNDGTMKRSIRICIKGGNVMTTDLRMYASRWKTREDAEKFCEYARKKCKGCTFKPVHA